MKKYALLLITITILAFCSAEIARGAVANPPPGAQKRRIIKPEATYPSTPVEVIKVMDQPPVKVATPTGTEASPSPTTGAAASTTGGEETSTRPKRHALGAAILLIVLIAAIALGAGGIFIINKMRAAKERDF